MDPFLEENYDCSRGLVVALEEKSVENARSGYNQIKDIKYALSRFGLPDRDDDGK